MGKAQDFTLSSKQSLIVLLSHYEEISRLKWASFLRFFFFFTALILCRLKKSWKHKRLWEAHLSSGLIWCGDEVKNVSQERKMDKRWKSCGKLQQCQHHKTQTYMFSISNAHCFSLFLDFHVLFAYSNLHFMSLHINNTGCNLFLVVII